jgi:folylpolyglutamate synthase
MAKTWLELDPGSKISVMSTIEDAIDSVRAIDGGESEIRVLVTGSFHLIGGALSILEGEDYALASTSMRKDGGGPA